MPGEEIRLYTVEDLQKIFRLGRTKTYQLMSSDGFPSFRLNKKLYISHDKLTEWIQKNCGKSYTY